MLERLIQTHSYIIASGDLHQEGYSREHLKIGEIEKVRFKNFPLIQYAIRDKEDLIRLMESFLYAPGTWSPYRTGESLLGIVRIFQNGLKIKKNSLLKAKNAIKAAES